MYNAHRGIPPGPAPNSRLAELLEQVRAEFEAQGGRANEYEHQRESLPMSLAETRLARLDTDTYIRSIISVSLFASRLHKRS